MGNFLDESGHLRLPPAFPHLPTFAVSLPFVSTNHMIVLMFDSFIWIPVRFCNFIPHKGNKGKPDSAYFGSTEKYLHILAEAATILVSSKLIGSQLWVTQVYLDCKSQKPQPPHLVMKASGN